jgi:O-antigen ligase
MQISDEALVERFARLMCWLGTVSAILGIVLYSINIPLIDLEAAGSDQYFVDSFGHYRASSIFLNPNSFAYFLMFYVCFSLFGKHEASKRRWLAVVCVVVAFLLSGSRSALAAVGFLLILRMIMSFAPRFRFPLLMVGSVSLLAVLVALIAMADLFVGKDIRFEKWSFSLDIFFKQMQRVYLGMPEDIPLEKLGLHFSDNMFLTILFKLGAVGAAIFATYYLFIMFRAIFSLAYGSRTMRPFAAYLLGSTVLFFYSNFLYFYPMVLIHGVAAGLLLVRIPSKSFSTFERVEAAQ